jgi:hypothetical protein
MFQVSCNSEVRIYNTKNPGSNNTHQVWRDSQGQVLVLESPIQKKVTPAIAYSRYLDVTFKQKCPKFRVELAIPTKGFELI